MCSDCVDDAGDTPRDDEDEEAVSAIAEFPAAIDDPWDRATDGERFPWRLWRSCLKPLLSSLHRFGSTSLANALPCPEKHT